MFRVIRSAMSGPAEARAQHRLSVKSHAGIEGGLNELQSLYSGPEDDSVSPIFLLSAGWRSGSTLVQRLIMSDERVLIWGEPFDECGPIQAMANTLRAFRPGWPPDDYYHDGSSPAQLTKTWVANLFPAPEALWTAHRRFLETLFSKPALDSGATRWGLKEVRLDVAHARYLRWLFPNARFVLLFRDPFEAYRSYCRYGRSWYNVFPDEPVFTPTAFGRHWRLLLEGYIEGAESLGAFLLRYEDLIGPNPPLSDLEAYLNIKIDHSLLAEKVGSSDRSGDNLKVGALDRFLLRRAASPTLQRVGYG
ncbi:MAG: sulfotransferase [Pseudomonadota bacterium]